MQYRYFECDCGNKFNAFISSDKKEAMCKACGKEAPIKWNDPKAPGTKLLFNYMER